MVFKASLFLLNVPLLEAFEHDVSNPIFPVSPVGFMDVILHSTVISGAICPVTAKLMIHQL